MSAGGLKKPCPNNPDGKHDWRQYEKVAERDKLGNIIKTYKVTACWNCGMNP